MKGKHVTPFILFLLVSSLPLAGYLCAQDPRSAHSQGQQPQQGQTKASDQRDVKTFSGKITKNHGGKYVLEDSSLNSPYFLDDQKTAKKYEGKSVLITGILDDTINTIHVEKIEAAG